MFTISAVKEVSVKNNHVCQLAIPSKAVADFECLQCTDINWNVFIMHMYKTGVLSDIYAMVGKKIAVISELLNFRNVVSTTPNYSLGSIFILRPIHLPPEESKYFSVYSD
jgi:hypothetical protein